MLRKPYDPLADLNRRIKQNPNDVPARMERAEAYLAQHKTDAALADIDYSIQLVLTHNRLRDAVRAAISAKLYNFKSRILATAGDWEGAVESLQLALSASSKDPEAWVQRGRIYRESGDFSNALHDFNSAIAVDKTNPQAYLARGIAYEALHDFARAADDYSKAIACDEKLGIAWARRARLRIQENKLQAAEYDAQTALLLDPYLVGPYVDLAFIAREKGYKETALQIIQHGLLRSPEHNDLLLQLAHLHVSQNQLEQAHSTVDRILQRNPHHPQALALRGQIYGRSGNPKAALADLKEALNLNPYDTEQLFNYALANVYAGNYTSALELISRVIQLTPEDQEARALRAQLALQLGIEPLDIAARVLEDFAYTLCGPGYQWHVTLQQLHISTPTGQTETCDAAVLALDQQKKVLLMVKIAASSYNISMLVKQPESNIHTPIETIHSQNIPEQPQALRRLLKNWLARGILITSNHQLRIGKMT